MEQRSVARAAGPSRSVDPRPASIARRAPAAAPTPRPGHPAAGPRAEGDRAPPAEAAPPFEWLDLVLYPWGQKPDPRGYAVYSTRPRPEPAPVILIDTVA